MKSEQFRSLIVFGVLAVAVAMLIVVLIPKNCSVARMEGFQDTATTQTNTTQCPKGTKSYVDSQGNTNCCRGQVTGTKCEGKPVCTFSSSLSSQLPICGSMTIKRKYTGPIDTFVSMLADNNPAFLRQLLNTTLPQIVAMLKKRPASDISQTDVTRFETLVKSEQLWFRTLQDDLRTGRIPPLDSEEERLLYKQEIMYILKQSMEIFKQAPLAKNDAFIREQIQNQVCKK